ncbi:MAG: ABC transporter ATP-binding protein [Ilumatobacteraceae bacterium]|nr:MAG: ABC transporter ATP-binding protein [Actinomycetota bacterium]
MLEIEAVTTRYGSISAVREVSLSVGEGEAVGLIGPNGAGKTTLLGTVAGLLSPSGGRVLLEGRDVTGWSPDRMLRAGLALVPEHRRVFVDLSVVENLRVGAVTVAPRERPALLDEMADLFPMLRVRWTTSAGYLSGGEAQQLAIARALMSKPRIVLMDEPSLGLAPTLVDMVFGLVDRLRAEGRTLLVVEQNARRMLQAADRAYVMRTGEISIEGPAAQLLARDDLFDTFVGAQHSEARER